MKKNFLLILIIYTILALFPWRNFLINDTTKSYSTDEYETHLKANENSSHINPSYQKQQQSKQINNDIKVQLPQMDINPIIFAFPILFSVLYVLTKKKIYYHESHFKEKYYRQLPTENTPAEVSYIFDTIGAKDIIATLLDLVRRKFLSIEQIENDAKDFINRIEEIEIKQVGKEEYESQAHKNNNDDADKNTTFMYVSPLLSKIITPDRTKSFLKKAANFINDNPLFESYLDKSDYKIHLVKDKDFNSLNEHEKFLIDWLIKDIGNDESVKLSSILESSWSRRNEFKAKYGNWINEVKSVAESKNFIIEPNRNYFCVMLVIAFDMIMPLFSISTLNDFCTLIIAIGFITAKLLFEQNLRSPDTQLCYEKWRAFKKFIKDFSDTNSSEIGTIDLWEHYLAYTVSLGIAKKFINRLPFVFKGNELQSPELVLIPYFYWHPSIFSAFEDSISQLTTSMSDRRK